MRWWSFGGNAGVALGVHSTSPRSVQVTLLFPPHRFAIKGEKRAEHEHSDGNACYAERRYGAFARSVRLPFEVKDEQVDAKYDKGVLTARVPKPAEVQQAVRRIEVKAT